MLTLLELDPNIVKPGWTPLLITIAIALVMVLLYRSMRAQFRRVDDNFGSVSPPTVASSPETPTTPAGHGTPDEDTAVETPTPTVTPTDDERAHRL